ncbi:MAG TPA: NAD(P)/FAD-dependent oxidoreductase [Woeseiaceae bacterium]
MDAEHFDVIIVGAGLSGIGAACHLQKHCPDKRFLILEGRAALGGTWDLFRYPGIRSDSDMHTLGYNFKPWIADKAIADGPAILDYMNETVDEHGLRDRIRMAHQVRKAEWSSKTAAWTLDVEKNDSAEQLRFSCDFLLMCSGYFSYKGGYTPEFKGRERFQGDIVHPQEWPQGLDYGGKRIVVIGSGATAVTLVPAMSKDAEHVVMLQRSPTYVVSRPDKDAIANFLRRVLPGKWAYAITRFKNTVYQQYVYRKARKSPRLVKKWLVDMVRKELGPDYDVEKHFVPSYNPWEQRLCLVPNSDLFEAIRSGKASVVTDHIDTFTENGILLQSGEELQADIIVTATGLALEVLGGMQVVVDGETVDFANKYTYKGMMFSGIPNMVSTFGYINASWTLRADMNAEYSCRLLNHMGKIGARQCTPRLAEDEKNMPQRPFIDHFSAGYLMRVAALLPKQGDRDPWQNLQNYRGDKKLLLKGEIEDGTLEFRS